MKLLKKALILCLSLLFITSSLVGCGDGMTEVVATCGEHEVLYEELRFLILSQKEAMKNTYGAEIFNTPESAAAYLPEWKATVVEKLRENYVSLAACRQYLPDLSVESDEITDAVDAMIEATIEELGGEEAFNQYLEATYMTEGFMRFTLAVYEMENHLLRALAGQGLFFADTQEQQFLDWILEGNGVCVQHIFISNDAGEDVAANRRKAEEARAKLANKEMDIKTMIGSTTYDEDTQKGSDYYVVRGVYDLALENAAFALTEVGAVSPVVESADGFYILVRMDDPEQKILRSKLTDMLKSYQWEHTERIKDNFRESIVFEWTDYGRELDWLAVV